MTDFRFIHAADIHLDSPLTGLSRFDGAPVERLRQATRGALSNLIDLAVENEVDFIVIAGDLFDGQWRDMGTGLHFAREMGRLAQVGIRAFVLKGNHDAHSKVTLQVPWPDNVTVFGHRKPETHRIEGLNVALHGHSFREAATVDNLVLHYPAAVTGHFNIGVLHTALEGYAQHASYAPCSLTDLRARGYDYWALGHVHDYQVLCEKPPVVFPGSLQGRHARETGAKGAVLVTVENGIASLERLIVDVARWHRLEVDVSEAADLHGVARQVRERLTAEFGMDDGRLHAVRIVLTGRSPAHGALVARAVQLREQVMGLAAGLGTDAVWIEKVETGTRPAFSLDDLRARNDALADFANYFTGISGNEQFIAELRTDLDRLLGAAGIEVTALCPELELVAKNQLGELIDQLTPALMARLHGPLQ